MKNPIITCYKLFSAVCLIILFNMAAIAQQGKANVEKEKGMSDMKQEKMEKHPEHKKDAQKHEHDNDDHHEHGKEMKENNGNAYGKNKGDMSGKEFGHQRSEQAKQDAIMKKELLDKTIDENEKKVDDAKRKIKVAKEKLEKDKKEKKISDTDYNKKKSDIAAAEKAVIELEEKVNKGKKIKVE
jgi:colicin import membrane protein